MDLLFDNNTLTVWLLQYGGLALFALLMLGIIALPIPEETLMVLSGILMHHEKLNIPSTLVASYLGVLCGISTSYLIGRTAGFYLITKYGKWIGLTSQRTKKAHAWFERFGKWTLFVGYFIPGVRHLTGVIAGSTKLSYRHFAIYAYCGAIVWVTLFLSIGYFFGPGWMAFFSRYKEVEIGFETVMFAIFGVIVIACVYLLYKAKRRPKR